MITEFKADLTAARTATLAEDYVTALRYARAARLALATIPDSELDREKISVSRDDIDLMIRDLSRQARAQSATESGNPLQTIKTRFTRD